MVCYSNKLDLQLLREMGVHPAPETRRRLEEKKRGKRKVGLKTVGIAVRAVVRMKRASEKWEENRRLQESLLLKLEDVKGRRRMIAGGKGGGVR